MEVVLVEDDSSIRELIESLLEINGYQVHSFANAKEFQRVNDTLFPDVYLIDYMLPDGNGLDLCKSLKANERTEKLPVIVMSAHPDLFELKGADEFLAKPFDIKDLINCIEKQL
ncbi:MULTISPECIES: response regulator [Christiangramia]|uniref:response regulator n=1 Tax=Christiangramia TaxID=292691 RepID=UPI0009F8B1A9|nr:response regulator transcription factor [Christiangramia flava]